MGTRGSFFIGDPTNLEEREYLCSKHFDCHPETVLEWMGEPKNAEEFELAIALELGSCNSWTAGDFGFPYPWRDQLFLTDVIYGFFDGCVHFTCGHMPWQKLTKEGVKSYYERYEQDSAYEYLPQFNNVPAPERKTNEQR